MANLKMLLMVSTILLSTKSCLIQMPGFNSNNSSEQESISESVQNSSSNEQSISSSESNTSSDSSSIEDLLESIEIRTGEVMTLEVGTSLQLRVEQDLTGKTAYWTVDNENVTVDENGLVGAIKPGISEVKVSVDKV